MTELYSKGLSRKKSLQLLEEIFTIVSIMIYSGAFSLLLSGSISRSCDPTALQNEPDSTIIRLIVILIYVISFGLLILRWKRVLYLTSKNTSVTILVGLALMSSLWSESFSTTLIPAIGLLGSTFFGVYFGSRYPLPKQLQLLGCALGIMIVLSTIFAVAFPSIGIMCGVADQEGSWRGVFGHKNGLGMSMARSAIIYCLLIKPIRWHLLPWLGISSSFLLLIFSKSTSSLFIVVALLILLPIYKSLRLREDILAPVILSIGILSTCSFALIFSHADSIVGYFGKDMTLTGRTDLWGMSLEMVQQRIFLGYGFQSFWEIWNGPGSHIRRALGWLPTHSHNGFIELFLDLGLIGFIVFLSGFVINLARAFIWVRLSKNSASFWPLMYLSFFFLTNTTESVLLEQNSISWVLYVALTLSLSIPPTKETSDVDKINHIPERRLSLRV